MKPLLLLLTAVVAVHHVDGWSETFNFFPCYVPDFSERMPNTLDNLIGIVEEFEHKESLKNLDEMAEMIVHRYRKDGIVFDPSKKDHQWYIGDEYEADKQKLINNILQQSRTFPDDSFEPRIECGLHLMVSHSLDSYPHSGVDDVWDGSLYRNNKNDRNKRSISSMSSKQYSSSSSSKQSSSSQKSSSSYSSSNSRVKRSFNPNLRASSSHTVPDGVEPAVHPIENGVIETPYGPVAAGTLLSGLSSIFNNGGYSIGSIMGTEADYMPTEMKGKTIIRPYASSLAGDISQLAFIANMDEGISPKVGPSGRYNNCTTCAQLFSLQNNQVSYMSRAELFAGLDVMIIYTAIHINDNNLDGLTLSQVLRHYYSEKGLPGQPDIKACNRLKLYKDIDREKLFEQALHFTYAYQHYFSTHQSEVEISQDFDVIEEFYTDMVKSAMDAMEDFINSYDFDDEGYNPCFYGGDGSFGRFGYDSVPETPISETMADIIAVYAEEGTKDNLQEQRQMIGDIGRRMGVSQYRSRLGVISGRTGAWLYQMANISNIGDWACNFTYDDILFGGGSKSDMLSVLDTLSDHYHEFYGNAMEDLDISSGHSQVVIWQVPGSLQTDVYTMNRTIARFREAYPDVNIVFVGRQEDPYEFLKDYEDDFISTSIKNYDEVLIWTVSRIHNAPRFFIYPACDPDNSSMASNYREEGHVYEGYVYPNYTTFITIPPQNFLYSKELTIKITGDVRVCFSRTNRFALEDYHVDYVNVYRDTDKMEETLVCVGGPEDEEDEEITIDYMCSSSYVRECNPLHMSVTGLGPTNSISSCNSDNTEGCEYPNQIQYEVMHDGMLCSGNCNLPTLLLLLLPALLNFLNN